MGDYKYFSLDEFVCSETGEQDMCPEFLNHSAEKSKKSKTPGTHTLGIAADVAVSGGSQRMAIVKHASAMGMSVGIAKTFVHVDIRKTPAMCWCY